MRKLTIAELRFNARKRFEEMYIKDEDKAYNLCNRFYRLCGIDDRLLIMNNDYEYYNRHRRYIEEQEAKADKMRDRLINDLKEYGLTLYYFGYLPTITEVKDGKPTGTEALARYFYN